MALRARTSRAPRLRQPAAPRPPPPTSGVASDLRLRPPAPGYPHADFPNLPPNNHQSVVSVEWRYAPGTRAPPAMRAGVSSAPAPTSGVASGLRLRRPAPSYSLPISLNRPCSEIQPKVLRGGAPRPDNAEPRLRQPAAPRPPPSTSGVESDIRLRPPIFLNYPLAAPNATFWKGGTLRPDIARPRTEQPEFPWLPPSNPRGSF